MFAIKIDGKTAAVTNSFDSAVTYADGIRSTGHRVTVVSLLPQDLGAAVHSLLHHESEPAEARFGLAA